MKVFNSKIYTQKLRQHFESYFGLKGKKQTWDKGPKDKLHKDFFILQFPPNEKHNGFCYCTVGMSIDRVDDNLLE